jgi:hypothetical protein
VAVITVLAYFQPKFEQDHLGQKLVDLSTDTLKVGLIATSGLAARSTSEGYEYVSQLLANNGSALTEVSGTGYSRLSLTSVSYTVSGLTTTLTSVSPAWTGASFTAYYGWLHDETASSGTDATRPLICIWDFGGAQTVSSSTFTLTVNTSGLVTWTAAA